MRSRLKVKPSNVYSIRRNVLQQFGRYSSLYTPKKSGERTVLLLASCELISLKNLARSETVPLLLSFT